MGFFGDLLKGKNTGDEDIKEIKDEEYYVKKGIIEKGEPISDFREFERERKRQLKEIKERMGKIKSKGKVIYNFSQNKSEKFSLKYEINNEGAIQTCAIGLKNLEGLANLSERQKRIIIGEIEKFEKNQKKDKREIKITFEGKIE
jgi:hypothetical protein